MRAKKRTEQQPVTGDQCQQDAFHVQSRDERPVYNLPAVSFRPHDSLTLTRSCNSSADGFGAARMHETLQTRSRTEATRSSVLRVHMRRIARGGSSGLMTRGQSAVVALLYRYLCAHPCCDRCPSNELCSGSLARFCCSRSIWGLRMRSCTPTSTCLRNSRTVSRASALRARTHPSFPSFAHSTRCSAKCWAPHRRRCISRHFHLLRQTLRQSFDVPPS
jgi:hypothetical protein